MIGILVACFRLHIQLNEFLLFQLRDGCIFLAMQEAGNYYTLVIKCVLLSHKPFLYTLIAQKLYFSETCAYLVNRRVA